MQDGLKIVGGVIFFLAIFIAWKYFGVDFSVPEYPPK